MAARWSFPVVLLAVLLCSCSDPIGPVPTGVSILYPAIGLEVGDSMQLVAKPYARDGAPVQRAKIIWSSSDNAVATVDDRGVVHGRRAGDVTIRATAGDAWRELGLTILPILGVSNSACAGTGTKHTGSVGTDKWLAKDSPHFIRDSIVVTRDLNIEAGAVICAFPKASLIVRSGGSLLANGNPDRRIIFTATDTTSSWSGIIAYAPGGTDGGGSITIDYADINFGGYVAAGYASAATVDHSYLHKTGFVASANFTSGTIRNSVVEDALVQISTGRFEATTIRRGHLEFFPAQPGTGSVTIDGGRIEDSPDIALTIGSTFSFRVPSVNIVKAPVITGSRGGIALMPADKFFALWPTTAEQAALLNNTNRTISLWGMNGGDVYLRAGLDWNLITFFPSSIASLTIESGTTVTIGILTITRGMTAIGTANAPITIKSGVCQSPPYFCGPAVSGGAPSRLSYVNFVDANFSASGSSPATLDHIHSNGTINLRAPGSRITDAEIHDVGQADFGDAALVLGADSIVADSVLVRITRGRNAVRITGSAVRVLSCEITDNSADGIVVTAGSAVEVHDCAIERNSGVGIRNSTTDPVNARRNWWGDPAGPTGPNGDGIAGNVDYANQLAGRGASNGPRAVRVAFTSTPLSVATSDTTRFAAVAYDESGAVIADPLIWSVSDTSLANVAEGEDGLLVGKRVGSVEVIVHSAGNPTAEARTTVSITPGAPIYRWTREPISINGRATNLSASAPGSMYATGDLLQSDAPVINTELTCCLLHREGEVWNKVPGVNLTWTGLMSVAPGGQVFVESNDSIGVYDGESFRRVAPKPMQYLYAFAAAGPDELFIASEKGRLYRYHNGRTDLVFSDSTVSNAFVWSRSATEVYFLAVDFNVSGFKTHFYKWNGQSLIRLPDLAGNRTFVSADERYVYSSGYRLNGSQWELLPGNAAARSYDVYTGGSSLSVLTSGNAVYLYDGQQIRTLWVGERLHSLSGVWVNGDEIFLATRRGFILHGRPE